ncbi:MAG: nucleotidyltransferase family protein [Anaerolineae bacterium]
MALPEEIAGIVLAAGFSSRMGTFKPLLPLGSSIALERAIASLRDGGVGDVVVVTGHRAEELRPHLARLGAREAFNRRPESGMFSSVLVGIDALADCATAAFILPADLPLVRPSTIRRLGETYLSRRVAVVYPSFHGKRGHPPLVARACFAESPPPTFPGGLATLLAQQADTVDVPVPDEGVLWDMDTPGEYDRMVARAKREGVPAEEEGESM